MFNPRTCYAVENEVQMIGSNVIQYTYISGLIIMSTLYDFVRAFWSHRSFDPEIGKSCPWPQKITSLLKCFFFIFTNIFSTKMLMATLSSLAFLPISCFLSLFLSHWRLITTTYLWSHCDKLPYEKNVSLGGSLGDVQKECEKAFHSQNRIEKKN